MTTKVKPIPDGYHSVTPYLIVSGAAKAIEFYKQVFGASELFRMDDGEGKIMHAEMQLGDSRVMLADWRPEMGMRNPQELNRIPVTIHVYVEDADAVTERAVAAGAKVIRPIQDQFYGDRSALLADPFGHVWNISTHIEDITPEELGKRAEAFKPKP